MQLHEMSRMLFLNHMIVIKEWSIGYNLNTLTKKVKVDTPIDEFDAVCLSEGIEGTKTRFKPDEKVILLDDVTLVLN